MADGGAKPAREDPSLLRPVQSYLLCFSFPNPSYSHIEPPTTDDSRDPETGRPSPVGAYTPPQRGSLFLPSSPGHHSLCSPPFLRRWSFPPSYLAPVPYLPLGCPSPLGLFFSLASPSPDLPNPRDIHPPQSAGRSDRGSGVSGEGFSIWNTGMDRSPSTPCESSRKHRRMDEVTPAAAISSPCLETKGTTLNPMSKRGLVWAVSVAVDNVIAHFSAARNVVQKVGAKLPKVVRVGGVDTAGNSRDSPRLGHMLLASLCPALTAVLGDGLKVYRHDLVMGRRPNSPWTVVEISVKAATVRPAAGQDTLDRAPVGWHDGGQEPYPFQSSQSLVNWTPQNSYIKEFLYLCGLQPIGMSLHVCMANNRSVIHPFPFGAGSEPWDLHPSYHTPRHLYNVFHQLDGLSQLSNSQRKFNAFVFALLNLKLLDFWMASLQNYAGALKTLYTPSAFLCLSHSGVFEELLLLLQPLSALSFQLDPLFEYHHSPQASEMAKPGHTVLSADQLDRTWRQGDEELCAPTAGQTFPGSPAGVEEGYRLQETLDQVSSWAWRLGRAVLELGVDREAQSATRPSDVSVGWWGQLARSCQVDLLLPHRPSRGLGTGPWWGEVARAQYNPMPGAQRDSMVGAQHDLTAEAESNPTNGVQHNPMARAQGTPTDGAGLEDRPWDIPHSTGTPRLTLASLFGARIPSIHSPRHPEHSRSRLPSDWLQLNIINLWRAPSAKTARPLGTGEVKTQGGENRFSARMVRTLCDHQAVEDGHLDFRRGETLEVLGCFNDAWIRCRRGNTSGLVPIEYTSLV
ncbi:LOW QUALITY PROTEIN: AP-4 complex accessory subunit RUSC1 [Narcine bancroftii]|uniref:LOW QUALITY PROTEIN: AP-4 complex accessory subunit RUSC1 n=1 Tax=Narcine bancroftii TaxID=1343680 RepID=UPI003831A394